MNCHTSMKWYNDFNCSETYRLESSVIVILLNFHIVTLPGSSERGASKTTWKASFRRKKEVVVICLHFSNIWLTTKLTGIDIFLKPASTPYSIGSCSVSGDTGHAVGKGSNACGTSSSVTIHFSSDAAGSDRSWNFYHLKKHYIRLRAS